MLVTNSNTNEVRAALHAFYFSGVALESVMWHPFMDRGIYVNADVCSYFKLL
jgi:hypothetical protein